MPSPDALTGPLKKVLMDRDHLIRMLTTSDGAAFFASAGIPKGALVREMWIDDALDRTIIVVEHDGWPIVTARTIDDVPELEITMIPFSLSGAEIDTLRQITRNLGLQGRGVRNHGDLLTNAS